MINILSITCNLAFAPYLNESIEEFLNTGLVAPRVVCHGGSGLTIRSDGELALRYQGRECQLSAEDALHYAAALELRIDAYDTRRMPDEVVISNFGKHVVLSHPQSELWIEPGVTSELIQMFKGDSAAGSTLPEWLKASVGGGQLLLSDQRNGRWVLLGAEHVGELERRLVLATTDETDKHHPPVLEIKGLIIHLQSAFKLTEILESFVSKDSIDQYEEITPAYSLLVSRSVEGIELRDSSNRVALTKREAQKRVTLIRAGLDRLNASQVERGRIRTVFADGEGGRWVLQWGDEVLVSRGAQPSSASPLVKRVGVFTAILDLQSAACAALTDSEAGVLWG